MRMTTTERQVGDPTTDCPKCAGPRTWKSATRKSTGRVEWSRYCQPCDQANKESRRRARGMKVQVRVPTDRKLGDPAGPCPKCGQPSTWYDKNGAGWKRWCPPCQADRSRNWAAENPDKASGMSTKWRKANPDRVKVHQSARRARLLGAESDGLTLGLSPRAKCYICLDAPVEHIDHVVPLAQGGSDLLSNKAGACASCNQAKKDIVWPGSPGWDEFVQKRRGART